MIFLSDELLTTNKRDLACTYGDLFNGFISEEEVESMPPKLRAQLKSNDGRVYTEYQDLEIRDAILDKRLKHADLGSSLVFADMSKVHIKHIEEECNLITSSYQYR